MTHHVIRRGDTFEFAEPIHFTPHPDQNIRDDQLRRWIKLGQQADKVMCVWWDGTPEPGLWANVHSRMQALQNYAEQELSGRQAPPLPLDMSLAKVLLEAQERRE